jgi:hypothetical protein
MPKSRVTIYSELLFLWGENSSLYMVTLDFGILLPLLSRYPLALLLFSVPVLADLFFLHLHDDNVNVNSNSNV